MIQSIAKYIAIKTDFHQLFDGTSIHQYFVVLTIRPFFCLSVHSSVRPPVCPSNYAPNHQHIQPVIRPSVHSGGLSSIVLGFSSFYFSRSLSGTFHPFVRLFVSFLFIRSIGVREQKFALLPLGIPSPTAIQVQRK